MPLSSKKIIEHLTYQKGSFTRSGLISSLIDTRIEKHRSRKKKAGSRKKEYRPKKDIENIDKTLFALASAGLISKQKKAYSIPDGLLLSGVLSINTTGNGVVESDDGMEILIRKDSINRAGNHDNVTVKINDFRKGIFFGEITGITRRDQTVFAARFKRKTKALIIYMLLDQPFEMEAALDRTRSDLETEKLTSTDSIYIVSLFDSIKGNRTECDILDIFPDDDESFDLKRISLKYDLPGPYPEIAGLADIADSISPDELKNRTDYRSDTAVTIDGATAKDFDDAVSLIRDSGRYILHVHIADVSAYVAMDSELDREAQRRGTSYYLANNVIPMLPEVLSNDLCSLRKGLDRLTMSAELIFDEHAELISSHFSRGLICVSERLTYENADKMIRSDSDSHLSKMLKDLDELAEKLYQRRIKSGRLDLNLSDQVMNFDGDRIVSITTAERLKSHRLVEECMLSANEAVARALKQSNVPSLYRIHEEMSEEKTDALIHFIKLYGIRYRKNADASALVQDILADVSGKEYEQVINLVVLKSMMQAYYDRMPLGHFGLGFEDYTHFTSPIRRYPDLIVHRCLKSLIDVSKPPYSEPELSELGKKTSDLERTAQRAERNMIKLKSCRLLTGREGQTFEAVITGISTNGFFVTLKSQPIEGMVPLRNLTDDFYLVNEDDFTVIGRRFSRRFRLGDEITVKLASVEIDRMRIDFEVA